MKLRSISSSHPRPLLAMAWRSAAVLVAAAAWLPGVAAFDYQYVGCYSSLSGYTSQGTNIYQTSKTCSTACSGYSHFAMTAGNECLCGNDAPAASAGDQGQCTVACVGYPSEPCGGSAAFTVYTLGSGSGAVDINAIPANADSSSASSSSSAGSSSASPTQSSSSSPSSSSSSSSTSSSSSSSASSSGTFETLSDASETSTSYSAFTSSSSSSLLTTSTLPATSSSFPASLASSTSSTSATSTRALEPSTVTSIINGQSTVLVTVPASNTATPTPTASSADASASANTADGKASSNSGGGGISSGAIAGIVIGVVVGLAVVLLGFFLLRRRARNNDDLSGGASSRLRTDPYATPSLKSSQSYLGGARGGSGNGAGVSRTPSDPFGSRILDDKLAFAPPAEDFMAVDQRLNPVMLGERRFSEGSLADDRDYSRKILRVANPDN